MFYEENRHLENEDIGYESPIYNITLYDKSFLIAIGKERKLIQKKNTFYFPIYLLNKTQVQTQIGAFEFESSKETMEDRIKPFLDSMGDLDVNRIGDPVLYSFADYDYFHTITNHITPVMLKEMEAEYMVKKADTEGKKEVKEVEEEYEEEEPRPFELSKDDIVTSPFMKQTENVLKEGVFSIQKTGVRILSLMEETKEDANKIKESYVESGKTTWIEKYMKNNQYNIVETLTNGDCLFDTLKTAYQQIGYETTIAKLRGIVAKEATKEHFSEYRELYRSTVSEIDNNEKELKRMVGENKDLKERLKNTTDKAKRVDIIHQANTIKKQHTELKEKYKLNTEFLKEFSYMKGIDSLEKFRAFIQTPSYWADDWAIDVLEQQLNMKFIIFSEQDYEEDDENNIIRCTLSIHNSNKIFTPQFYIFTTYSGNHYKLISYSNKYIFTFREIPYDVKTMIVIKCMERNSGIFSKIPDFKHFKEKLGVTDGDGDEYEDGEDEDTQTELKIGGRLYDVDTTTVFTFYNKSNGIHKPGKASNEKILSDNIHKYTNLAVYKNWRKKIDDEYASTFTLDNKKWKTVEHYYQASKFKKHNPHFYNQFSLDDTTSEFATDVELAKAAGSQKGIFKRGKKQVLLRPPEIRIDPDFYGSRQKEEREKSLYAKFSQNEELKSILLSTKNAVLRKFIPKRRPENDISLMTIRQRIEMEN